MQKKYFVLRICFRLCFPNEVVLLVLHQVKAWKRSFACCTVKKMSILIYQIGFAVKNAAGWLECLKKRIFGRRLSCYKKMLAFFYFNESHRNYWQCK